MAWSVPRSCRRAGASAMEDSMGSKWLYISARSDLASIDRRPRNVTGDTPHACGMWHYAQSPAAAAQTQCSLTPFASAIAYLTPLCHSARQVITLLQLRQRIVITLLIAQMTPNLPPHGHRGQPGPGSPLTSRRKAPLVAEANLLWLQGIHRRPPP